MPQSTTTFVNFGRNVRFTPRRHYAPQSEAELLAILAEHRHGQIRVVGARHSWSGAVVSDDALVDMRHFDAIRVEERHGRTYATVGGGCRIKHVLARLQQQGLTTPSVGLITEQTVAGAISTATHGSGKHSLSHYVTSLRIACYSPDGETPEIRQIDGGAALRAARCGLGCLGVIVDVTFACIPQYLVGETLSRCDSIEQVLERQAQAPLQQFYLVPHLWRYYIQERSVSDQPRPSWAALLYRWYWFLSLDVGLHLILKLLVSLLRSRRLVRLLYRSLLPAVVVRGWTVVDRSDRMLVMEHELFRHLEMELFVPASELTSAATFVAEILQLADGRRQELSPAWQTRLSELGLAEQAAALRGTYCHHYVVCFRRVLADDALLAMSAGEEDSWYSISFITYDARRELFYDLARLLAASMARLFRARLHWGKWFPLGADDVRRMYARLDEFLAVRATMDPRGVFTNAFVASALGLTDRDRGS